MTCIAMLCLHWFAAKRALLFSQHLHLVVFRVEDLQRETNKVTHFNIIIQPHHCNTTCTRCAKVQDGYTYMYIQLTLLQLEQSVSWTSGMMDLK